MHNPPDRKPLGTLSLSLRQARHSQCPPLQGLYCQARPSGQAMGHSRRAWCPRNAQAGTLPKRVKDISCHLKGSRDQSLTHQASPLRPGIAPGPCRMVTSRTARQALQGAQGEPQRSPAQARPKQGTARTSTPRRREKQRNIQAKPMAKSKRRAGIGRRKARSRPSGNPRAGRKATRHPPVGIGKRP